MRYPVVVRERAVVAVVAAAESWHEVCVVG